MIVADCDSLRRNVGSKGWPLLAETACLLAEMASQQRALYRARRMLGRQ
jgi:hypothetical protein